MRGTSNVYLRQNVVFVVVVFLFVMNSAKTLGQLCNKNTNYRCNCGPNADHADHVTCTDLLPLRSSLPAVKLTFFGCLNEGEWAKKGLDKILKQKFVDWTLRECSMTSCGENKLKKLDANQLVLLKTECQESAGNWSVYFVVLNSAPVEHRGEQEIREQNLVDSSIFAKVAHARRHLLGALLDRDLLDIKIVPLNSTLSEFVPIYRRRGFIVGCGIAGYIIFVWVLAAIKCFLDKRKRKRETGTTTYSRASFRARERTTETVLPAITARPDTYFLSETGADLESLNDSVYDNVSQSPGGTAISKL